MYIHVHVVLKVHLHVDSGRSWTRWNVSLINYTSGQNISLILYTIYMY